MEHDQKKYHFIYKTTNVITGKFYVGMHSTNNLDDGYIGSGRRLKYSILKYGISNHQFEILEFYETRQQLCDRERELVNEEMLLDSLCMNLKVGGRGGFLPIEACRRGGQQQHTSDTTSRKCLRLRDKDVREKAANTLKETLAQKKLDGYDSFFACREKVLTDEVKEKRRKTFAAIGHQQGAANSQFGTCWVFNDTNQVAKKIKVEELQEMLDSGWRRGRR